MDQRGKDVGTHGVHERGLHLFESIRATLVRLRSHRPGKNADGKVVPVHPLLAGRTCYHRFEIEPGLYTPGTHIDVEPGKFLDQIGVPQDLSGLRALDVGAWDGAFTFELAKRGAEVTALDLQDPDVTIFNAARAILNAQVNYIRGSVYDLLEMTHGKYNIVLFAGVYYHLKSPVLAFQRIREVLDDDGRLYIEGATCTRYLATQLASAVPGANLESLMRLVDEMPISLFDHDHQIYKHWSNWFFPTTACLRGMLRDSGFSDIELRLRPNALTGPNSLRIDGHARANPVKARPSSQQYEHEVYVHDYTSPRLTPLTPESPRAPN